MPVDKLTIINTALARLGAQPLEALDEETDRARSVAAVYASEIDALFGECLWHFARKTVALDKLDGTPENGWRFHFAWPGGALQLISLLAEPRHPDLPHRDFTREGFRLYAHRERLWGRFLFRVDPDTWPPLFRVAAELRLAAALAMPIADSRTLKESLTADAVGTPSEGGRGGALGRAIAEDARTAPPAAPLSEGDPLTVARFG